MKRKNLKYYFIKAKKEGWALAQFNFSSAEQLKGIVLAAERQHSPLLVGTSERDSNFVGLRQAVALVEAWRKDTGLPIFLNLDHGKSFEYIREAIEAGYDAVHFDGSDLDLESNITLTKKIVAFARKKGISVIEGELGKIPGRSTLYRERIVMKKEVFTKPEEAELFVKKTGVDSFAFLFGNAHGMYRGGEHLDFQRLQEIKKRVKSFLILHGGSGIPRKEVLYAVKLGIVKINISTELRVAFTQTLREILRKNPTEVTPYSYFPPVVAAVQKAVEENIRFLGSADKM